MLCLFASNSSFRYCQAANTTGRCVPNPNFAFSITSHFAKRPLPRITLDEKDIEEAFCRGSGPGGQKINKSTNKVRLRHVPTGVTVAVQEQRGLAANRLLARKLLRDKVDLILNGAESRIAKGIVKKQRRKMKSAGRSKKKYDKDGSVVPSATDASGEDVHEVGDDDIDADDADDADDDGSDGGYDESDDDERIAKPVS